VLLHQDAFASDYQEDEYMLLGVAIKYAVSPKSKILFVSQESSPDVVQEAFRLGALGYVVKTHAGSELLAAVESVRQDRRFVSAGLASHVPTELANASSAPEAGD
jgi:DNA-binding NarL/FixJ family response regulator